MSAVPESEWVAITQALDPQRTPEVGPELERLYVEPPYSPAAQISRKLIAWTRAAASTPTPGRPPKFLFCGARGSGKTTQLRHLFSQLKASHDVMLLDLAPVLPERVGTVAIIVHMGLALLARQVHYAGGDAGAVLRRQEAKSFQAALERLLAQDGEDASSVDLAPLVEAIGFALTTLDLVSGGAATALVGAAKVVSASYRQILDRIRPVTDLTRAPTLTRVLASSELGAAIDLGRIVGDLAGVLHGVSSRPPLLLVDGLDKILKVEDAFAAFENTELLRELDVAAVLSGPPVLRSAARFAGLRLDLDVRLNHNLPVVDAEGQPRPEGIDALRRILSLRLAGRAEGRFHADAVATAARCSSGIPREFLRFLVEAALVAEERGDTQVQEIHVRAVVKETRLILQQTLTSADVERLGLILDTHRMGEQARDQELFYEGFIASYPNDDAYFRPNEILTEWVRSERERLSALGRERRTRDAGRGEPGGP